MRDKDNIFTLVCVLGNLRRDESGVVLHSARTIGLVAHTREVKSVNWVPLTRDMVDNLFVQFGKRKASRHNQNCRFIHYFHNKSIGATVRHRQKDFVQQ
jgi:hypothetical protein